MQFPFKKILKICSVLVLIQPIVPAFGETISGAMTRAYDHNPDLAAARAGLRATDEGVAIAKSGYRPTISGSLTGTYNKVESFSTRSATGSVTITQKLFDGFATQNNVGAAKSAVFAGREDLKSQEINILQSAAQAYANLSRDNQLVTIRRQNINFLNEQLKAAKSRLRVGEGTRTDVAQAEAQLALAKALLTAANAQAKSSAAVYVQIIGVRPSRIGQPKTAGHLLPRNLDAALARGLSSHPSIMAAQYNVDAADFQVDANLAALLPGVSVSGSLSENDDRVTTKSVTGTVSVPIYSGGANHARVRQAKQRLAQQEANVDSVRRSVEQSIVSNWVSYEAALATLSANRAELEAAKLALNGIVEERKVGQRTTLDVLNAQQSVLSARESIVQSQRDAVVSSYAALAAMGLLTVDHLKLRVKRYDPNRHYLAVKDKWFGLRAVEN